MVAGGAGLHAAERAGAGCHHRPDRALSQWPDQSLRDRQTGFLANDLLGEIRDWAVWDETYRHVIGRNPDYYDNGNYNRDTFLRTSLVMVLNRQGKVVSTAHWNGGAQRIEPLPPREVAAAARLLPGAAAVRQPDLQPSALYPV